MKIPNIPSAAYAVPGLRYESIPRDIVIMSEVCKHFRVDLYGLKMRKKTFEIAHARQVAMYLMCEYSMLSLKSIGRIFNRHHTTVMYAREEAASHYAHEEKYRIDIDKLKNKISDRIRL